jgi:hypothetical protein
MVTISFLMSIDIMNDTARLCKKKFILLEKQAETGMKYYTTFAKRKMAEK